jgi:hypothetical protein
MDIDWKLLTQVRDRHKVVAQEHVAHERRAADQRDAQVRQADARLQAQIDAKARLWQSTIGGQTGGFSVAELRQTSVWSRALDTRIAQAGATMRDAQQQAAQQQQRLDASRRQLRVAADEFQRAEQMGMRARAVQLRRLETRQEDAAEEAALQIWSAHKAL